MNKNKILIYSFKIIILIAAYSYIYVKFQNIEFKDFFEFNNYSYLFFSILLMPLNWLIESKKWQLLISKFEKINTYTSFKAILSGLTTSVFTPNRVGEFVGRVMYISRGNRIKATFATIIGSYSQVLITIIIGSVSVLLIRRGVISIIDNNLLLKYFFVVFSIILTIIFFSLNVFGNILKKIKFKHIEHVVSAISNYSFFDLIKVVLYSLMRYIVFFTQFYLLIMFFDIDISVYDGFITIGIFYLFLMFVPTFVISEPGVRVSTSLVVFSFFVKDVSLVVYAVTLLWLINIVFPTIIGSLFFVKTKI